MVLREGLVFTLAGLGAGLVLARLAAQAMSALLFQVGAGDLMVYSTASLLLTGVVMTACFLPAWRASRLDPATVLREQ